MKLDINGLEVEAEFDTESVQNIFLPLLREMTKRRQKMNRPLIVFLAGPPAVGKSTLAAYLERLSEENSDVTPLETVGLDGFHYSNQYLKEHFLEPDVSLYSIKGAPETFDIKTLRRKLKEQRDWHVTAWPYYDRNCHEPREDWIRVDRDIVLLEGNWLLLDEEPWQDLKEFADLTVSIKAEPEQLKERLIERKTAGGSSREEAEAWYDHTDGPNIARYLEHTQKADVELLMTGRGRFSYNK